MTNNKQKKILYGNWKREFEKKSYFTITSDYHKVHITGGSVIICDSEENVIKTFKGYNYLYTGDISPDESDLFALENGKHFYIYSLKDYSQKLRVTLPRTYEAIDVCGFFSEDGIYLYVPVEKYVENKYTYWLCKYDTKSYSLLEMNRMPNNREYRWHL